MGCRAPGAGHAQQAATCRRRRRRAHPAQRRWPAARAGGDVLPVGLVRRQSLRLLEMTRFLIAAVAFWLMAALLAGSAARSDPHTPQVSRKAAALFKTSEECVACHNGLRTSDNEDVSIGTMWRSTIMANSARDPYFHAALRREVMDHPSQAAEIQHECAGCHAPMLQRTAHAGGRMADVLAKLPLRVDDALPEHRLAADG